MAKIIAFILCFSVLFADFKVKSYKQMKTKNTILQKYEESCGASALATLINLYDNNITEEEILNLVSTTDIISFSELKNVAEKLNFKAEGYKIDIKTFNKLSLPIIARVDNRENYAHFVVVVNSNGDFVTIFDPAIGEYIQTKKEFFDWWTNKDLGYILIVLPKTDIKFNHKLILPNRNLFLH